MIVLWITVTPQIFTRHWMFIVSCSFHCLLVHSIVGVSLVCLVLFTKRIVYPNPLPLSFRAWATLLKPEFLRYLYQPQDIFKMVITMVFLCMFCSSVPQFLLYAKCHLTDLPWLHMLRAKHVHIFVIYLVKGVSTGTCVSVYYIFIFLKLILGRIWFIS